MATVDSVIDREALAYARALLKPPIERENLWAPVGAAFLAAVSALVFAFAMVMAPPVTTSRLALEPDTASEVTAEASEN